MNIKELAEQAGLAYKMSNGMYWIDAGEVDIHLERFAELVSEQTHTNNKAKWYQEGYEAVKREWVGLTEDESDDIYNAHHNTYGECITSAYDLVLDIEAKLKEKNGG
jgi:NDP-sugar pyrophosphorylase family protein